MTEKPRPLTLSKDLWHQREVALRKQERWYGMYQLGQETVAAYRVGDTYLGAWGDAERLGIKDPELRGYYIDGYLSRLPHPLRVNAKNIIIEIGPPR